MTKFIYGTYDTFEQAEVAIEQLISRGINPSEMAIATNRDFTEETVSRNSVPVISDELVQENNNWWDNFLAFVLPANAYNEESAAKFAEYRDLVEDGQVVVLVEEEFLNIANPIAHDKIDETLNADVDSETIFDEEKVVTEEDYPLNNENEVTDNDYQLNKENKVTDNDSLLNKVNEMADNDYQLNNENEATDNVFHSNDEEVNHHNEFKAPFTEADDFDVVNLDSNESQTERQTRCFDRPSSQESLRATYQQPDGFAVVNHQQTDDNQVFEDVNSNRPMPAKGKKQEAHNGYYAKPDASNQLDDFSSMNEATQDDYQPLDGPIPTTPTDHPIDVPIDSTFTDFNGLPVNDILIDPELIDPLNHPTDESYRDSE